MEMDTLAPVHRVYYCSGKEVTDKASACYVRQHLPHRNLVSEVGWFYYRSMVHKVFSRLKHCIKSYEGHCTLVGRDVLKMGEGEAKDGDGRNQFGACRRNCSSADFGDVLVKQCPTGPW